jgi:hypothetical protein
MGMSVLGLRGDLARSVAPAGFGLDNLVEGASAVVVWELAGTGENRSDGSRADRSRVCPPRPVLAIPGTGILVKVVMPVLQGAPTQTSAI